MIYKPQEISADLAHIMCLSISLLEWREGNWVSEVKVGKNESLDSALRRFKRNCQKSGVLSEVRKREHYEKPSVRRKKKSEAARKRKRW